MARSGRKKKYRFKFKKASAGLLFILVLLSVFIFTTYNGDGNPEDPGVGSSEEEPPEPEFDPISYLEIGGLELPVTGATGYTSVSMELKADASFEAETISVLEAGTAFEILKEEAGWWLIENETAAGWLEHKYCMINLPDVIPSIVYDLTNTYSSQFVSSGKPIPGITGEALYEGKSYNNRLEKDEYIVLVLYQMARKICSAQQAALTNGDSLKIYEAYRPYATQKAVLSALTELSKNDSEVMAGINSAPWEVKWFISTGISNHQKGGAIDVSLVKVDSKEDAVTGMYTYPEITEYTEYAMPSQIHELSMASAAFTAPFTTYSKTAWQSAAPAPSMNEAAIRLQTCCAAAGLTPIASEWWHFNDLDAISETSENRSNGGFSLNKCYSTVPSNEAEPSSGKTSQ